MQTPCAHPVSTLLPSPRALPAPRTLSCPLTHRLVLPVLKIPSLCPKPLNPRLCFLLPNSKDD